MNRNYVAVIAFTAIIAVSSFGTITNVVLQGVQTMNSLSSSLGNSSSSNGSSSSGSTNSTSSSSGGSTGHHHHDHDGDDH